MQVMQSRARSCNPMQYNNAIQFKAMQGKSMQCNVGAVVAGGRWETMSKGQCNAKYCNALQSNSKYCSVNQGNAEYCNAIQGNSKYCNAIQGNAQYCNANQCKAKYCNAMHWWQEADERQCQRGRHWPGPGFNVRLSFNIMVCSALRCGMNVSLSFTDVGRSQALQSCVSSR